ncbi:MAG: DUF393 domain-containing protein [Kiritimatiellae bacterium]|nr:DUF393 domain-containing protein [Kiritimatiellia bacterium]
MSNRAPWNRPTTPLRLFFDGACPFCRAEIDWLQRRDRHGRLVPVDIAAAGFDAARWGFDPGEVRRVLHAIAPDGRVLRGMEAVRAAYGAVGLGWLVAPTGWPGLRGVFDRLYAAFARNRLAWGARWLRLRSVRPRAATQGSCARCAG